MKYLFKGSLCGFLCEDCREPLSGIEVLIYLPWQKERVAETAVADVKDTFRLVTKEEAASRKKLLIASTKTDEFGNFEVELDEKYSKTAFDIDFVCGTVPRVPPKPRKEPLIRNGEILPETKMYFIVGHIAFRLNGGVTSGAIILMHG